MFAINQKVNKVLRYVQRVSRLNNLAVKQIKNGDFNEAVSTCKCVLKALQRIDDSRNMEKCIEILEKMIERAMITVMKKLDTTLMTFDSNVMVLCLRDGAFVTNLEHLEYENSMASPIHIDCSDIHIVRSEEVEIISSIAMYNIGVSMYLSSRLHRPETRSAKLDGCREVLELVSEASQATNESMTQIGRNRETFGYTISLVVNNILFAIYNDRSDIVPASKIRQSGNKLKTVMREIKAKESREWRKDLLRRAASAA